MAESSASPQVLTSKRDAAKYKGPAADLWSSAVILFVMLSGAYPFEDARDPRNMKKTVEVRAAGTRTTDE
jgi:serine/threonine protein kinase